MVPIWVRCPLPLPNRVVNFLLQTRVVSLRLALSQLGLTSTHYKVKDLDG